eukprot:TRINITY_DN57310_c0_g1_i1.p1 TRINITY_DN57310_c0_g1~~TRINITY_DN57310_c0_g1_i1.p1  ORF type:complete len:211 (+),score=34.53 TRINITY_DN57310_c0_g1_i1:33-665(+)
MPVPPKPRYAGGAHARMWYLRTRKRGDISLGQREYLRTKIQQHLRHTPDARWVQPYSSWSWKATLQPHAAYFQWPLFGTQQRTELAFIRLMQRRPKGKLPQVGPVSEDCVPTLAEHIRRVLHDMKVFEIQPSRQVLIAALDLLKNVPPAERSEANLQLTAELEAEYLALPDATPALGLTGTAPPVQEEEQPTSWWQNAFSFLWQPKKSSK